MELLVVFILCTAVHSATAQSIDGCPMYSCRPSGTFSFDLSVPRENVTIGWVNTFFLGPIPNAQGCVGNTIALVCQSNGPGPNSTGLMSLYQDTGQVRWRDLVLRFPSLPVLDAEGNIWGADGSNLMSYDINGKPKLQVHLTPNLRSLFGVQFVAGDLILLISETGRIVTIMTNGTISANIELRGVVQGYNGTFIPTSPAIVNGIRFYVMTEFLPDKHIEDVPFRVLGLQRLYAVDNFHHALENYKIAWYYNFEPEIKSLNKLKAIHLLRYAPKSEILKKVIVSKIQGDNELKPSILRDAILNRIYILLPPPFLHRISHRAPNGINTLWGVEDNNTFPSRVFQSELSATNMVLYEPNSEKDVGRKNLGHSKDGKLGAGSQLWISLSDGKLTAIDKLGNISKEIDLPSILKTNFTITSKISTVRSRVVDEDLLVFGINISSPTLDFRKMASKFGIDTSKNTPSAYLIGIDTPENKNINELPVAWMIPTPEETIVTGQIIGIKANTSGGKDHLIAFAQIDGRFGRLFSVE